MFLLELVDLVSDISTKHKVHSNIPVRTHFLSRSSKLLLAGLKAFEPLHDSVLVASRCEEEEGMLDFTHLPRQYFTSHVAEDHVTCDILAEVIHVVMQIPSTRANASIPVRLLSPGAT